MTPSGMTAAHRTDPEIFIDAREALDRLPSAPGAVRVHVLRGAVTLTGGVHWPFERTEAEDAVRHIEGVRHIVNNIIVFQPVSRQGFEPPDDPDSPGRTR
jgi:osmotically-inducible protein OsmY